MSENDVIQIKRDLQKKTGIVAKQLFGRQVFNPETKEIEFHITHAINSKNDLVVLKPNLSRN